jgi:class 3 adenylate cyclase/DNA-binding CsgD family transcriptional regulator/tetratricopeptide (TPR) repeat protein
MSGNLLSRREFDVAGRYAEGKSYRAIAEELGIAPATVRTHLNTIYRKLEITNKFELARFLDRHSTHDQEGQVAASDLLPQAARPLSEPARPFELDGHVHAFLNALGLTRYAPLFAEQAVDMEVLASLEEGDLRSLGIEALGHRKRLLAAIERIRADGRTAEIAPAPVNKEPSSERRRITLMHVELVGSTELSVRLDPEEYHDALSGFQRCVRDVIDGFDGHVALVVGAGLLAYFGWPRSNEHDAERAVRAGVAIIEALDGLQWHVATPAQARIGIATGLVVVEDFIDVDGRPNARIAGETPNLAMKLQSEAPPGGIVVSEVTHQLIDRRFAGERFGDLRLEGFERPVPAWLVKGERAWSETEERQAVDVAPIVGRDGELALILDRWALAASGEGQIVLLRGDAGIGKSRITQAVLDAIQQPRDGAAPLARVLRFHCSPHHSNNAFWPVTRQLTGLAGLQDGEEIEAALDKIETLLSPLTDGNRHDAVNALFADLLGIDSRSRYAQTGLPAQARRLQTMQALADLFVRMAERRPLIIVFDDVHWVDPTTLEFMKLFFSRIQRCRILVIMTSRPENMPSFNELSYLTLLSLNRLDLGTMRAIVRRVAGDRLDASIIDAIIERADGVPLFVEELTKTMLATGQTRVPDTLYDSLMARLDQTPKAKGTAQVASCIGRQFEVDLLIKVAEDAPSEIHESLDALVAADVIHATFADGVETRAFKHALLQDVAYQNLLRRRRQKIHEKVFRVLHAEYEKLPSSATGPRTTKMLALLANHASGALLHEIAAQNWEKAGRLAAGQFAHVEAVNYFEKGSEALDAMAPAEPPRDRRRALLLELVASLRILGRYQQALDALEKAAALTDPAEHLELARIHYLRGYIYFPMGRADECRVAHETALTHAVDAGSAEFQARVLGGLADAAYVSGRMMSAFTRFDRCIELAQEHGFPAIAVANLPMRGWGRYFQCDPAGALDDGLASIEGAVRDGSVREEMLARAASQFFFWELGDAAASREQCEKANELAKRLGASNFEPFNLLNAALLTAEQDRDAAVKMAMAAVEMAKMTGPAFTGPWAQGALAVVAGDDDTRRRAVEDGLEILDKGALAHCHFWFYRHALDASIAARDWPAVEPLAARLEAFVAAEPLPWITFILDRARALAAYARDPADQGALGKLQRLRAAAERHRLVVARRGIDEALTASGPTIC